MFTSILKHFEVSFLRFSFSFLPFFFLFCGGRKQELNYCTVVSAAADLLLYLGDYCLAIKLVIKFLFNVQNIIFKTKEYFCKEIFLFDPN